MAKRIISGELFEESWIELDEEVAVMMETASARTKQRKLQDPAIEVNKVTPEKKTEL